MTVAVSQVSNKHFALSLSLLWTQFLFCYSSQVSNPVTLLKLFIEDLFL
jgi:hypothetical protein